MSIIPANPKWMEVEPPDPPPAEEILNLAGQGTPFAADEVWIHYSGGIVSQIGPSTPVSGSDFVRVSGKLIGVVNGGPMVDEHGNVDTSQVGAHPDHLYDATQTGATEIGITDPTNTGAVNATAWTINGSTRLKYKAYCRIAYNSADSTPVIYGYWRYEVFDDLGHCIYLSGETKETIYQPPKPLPYCLFAVLCTRVGGAAGSDAATCTFNYDVTDLGGSALGGTMNPAKARIPLTAYTYPAPASLGVGYYNLAGTFCLYEVAGEVPAIDHAVSTSSSDVFAGVEFNAAGKVISIIQGGGTGTHRLNPLG